MVMVVAGPRLGPNGIASLDGERWHSVLPSTRTFLRHRNRYNDGTGISDTTLARLDETVAILGKSEFDRTGAPHAGFLVLGWF